MQTPKTTARFIWIWGSLWSGSWTLRRSSLWRRHGVFVHAVIPLDCAKHPYPLLSTPHGRLALKAHKKNQNEGCFVGSLPHCSQLQYTDLLACRWAVACTYTHQSAEGAKYQLPSVGRQSDRERQACSFWFFFFGNLWCFLCFWWFFRVIGVRCLVLWCYMFAFGMSIVEVKPFSLLKYAEPKFPQANATNSIITLYRANSQAANGKTLQESGRLEFKQGSHTMIYYAVFIWPGIECL